MVEKDKYWQISIPTEEKTVRLDLKDLKILDALINNSRTTLTTLNKITRLSKPSLINRIDKYHHLGLIKNNSTLIDLLKLGIKVYNVEIKTGIEISEKNKYIEYLKSLPLINQIITLSGGNFDILTRVFSKDNKSLNRTITQITKGFNIKDINVLKVERIEYKALDLFDLKQKIIVNKHDRSFAKAFTLKKINNHKFDKKDLEILYLLSSDSKIAIHEIAHRLSLSVDTVRYKIRSLIRKGIIISFFVNYDLYKLGFSAYLIKLKMFNREKEEEVIHYLNDYGRCNGVLKHNESWNLFAYFSFKNRIELGLFEKKLMNKFGNFIDDYEIILVQEQSYYNLFPKGLKELF